MRQYRPKKESRNHWISPHSELLGKKKPVVLASSNNSGNARNPGQETKNNKDKEPKKSENKYIKEVK